MEIYQLRTFLAVARCQHLTRASEQLHVSQPAVSKHIKALEEELGLTLFERTPSGVFLTKSGKEIFHLAEVTLSSAMALTNKAAQLRGEVAGTVKLGTIVDPESLRLGEFLARMLQWHPMIDVKLKHGISGEIAQQVTAGDLDAGYYLGRAEMPGMGALELRKVVYVVIAPASWAQKLHGATLQDLAGLPWVGPNLQSSQHRILHDLFADAGVAPPTAAIEVDQESSMISLVKSGVGLCLMREEVSRSDVANGDLVMWEGVIPLCPLSFIYRENRKSDAPIATMLHVLESMVEENPALPSAVGTAEFDVSSDR